MVNPISFPAPQAYSGGADFSMLANLGNVYKKAQEDARQQEALGKLGQGQASDTQALLTSNVPSLAQLGLNMQDRSVTRQREDVANTQAQSNWQQQQAIRQAQERRAQSTFDEDSPEGRKQKLTAAGADPNDPTLQLYVATGQNPPSVIQQQAEKRAQTTFDQSQQYATREGRLKAVREGELNIDDPDIRRWVALGGDVPDPAKNRLGLGAITYTREKDGTLHGYQLSATGVPVEVKLPEGQQILGPGEIAQQKAEATATGKATGGAKVALPDVVRHTDELVGNIDKILSHESKSTSLGRGSQLPDWMVAGTGIADFRERVKQLGGEAMQQTMASLKGAGLGSVSDYEQKNLMTAFVRASTAQTEKAFNEAMNDAKKSAERIRDIARGKARGDFSERPGATAPQGNKPPLGDIIPLN